MGDKTGISWTDATWNCVVGCSIYSPGCKNCYAMRMAARIERMGGKGGERYAGLTQPSKAGPVWTGAIRLAPEMLEVPLHWSKPRRIFVNSMSDLFHEDLPDKAIDRVFAVMALAPQHTFQVLTKRSDRMRSYMNDPQTPARVWRAVYQMGEEWDEGKLKVRLYCVMDSPLLYALGQHGAGWGGERPWPLKNVWAGVSVEDRDRTARIDDLRQIPAVLRFLSCEPLLEDLGHIDLTGIGWCIIGGESGPGAREFNVGWAYSLLDQCNVAGVPFFMKQLGSRPVWPSDRFGEVRVEGHGSKWDDPVAWPYRLQVQQFPQVAA